MKYSFIVPIYNGASYIERCFTSLLNQTYKNFEIIAINDGSTDDSGEILDTYGDRIRRIDEENKGLSEARNQGVKIATGDYIIFIDVDDSIQPNLLEKLETYSEKPDLFKIGYSYIYGDNKIDIIDEKEETLSGEQAFVEFVMKKQVFEMAVLYVYKTTFYKQNEFQFVPGKYHEDFGLIPLILLKSQSVIILPHSYYLYYQTEDSITRNVDYKKTVQKANDILFHYRHIKQEIQNVPIEEFTKKVLYSFIANAVLAQISLLSKEEKKQYKREIKKDKIVDDLLATTFFRKIKKIIRKITI